MLDALRPQRVEQWPSRRACRRDRHVESVPSKVSGERGEGTLRAASVVQLVHEHQYAQRAAVHISVAWGAWHRTALPRSRAFMRPAAPQRPYADASTAFRLVPTV